MKAYRVAIVVIVEEAENQDHAFTQALDYIDSVSRDELNADIMEVDE